MRVIRKLPAAPREIALSPNGTRIAAGIGIRPQFAVWDVATGELISRSRVRGEAVSGLLFVDEETVASINPSGLAIWRESDSSRIRYRRAPTGVFSSFRPQLAFDGAETLFERYSVSARDESRTQFSTVIRRLNPFTRDEQNPLVLSGGHGEEMAAGGQRLFLADAHNSINVLDPNWGHPLAQIHCHKRLRDFAVAAETSVCVMLSRLEISAWPPPFRDPLWSGPLASPAARVLMTEPDRFALLFRSGEIGLFDARDGKDLFRWYWADQKVLSLAAAKDCPLLAAGLSSGEIIIWDAAV